MTIQLYVLSGKDLGRVESFETFPVIIGRGESAELRLPSPAVSREHARISLHSSGSVQLEDLKSTSGTFLEGEKIRRCLLEDGAAFRVADVELRIRMQLGPKPLEAHEEPEQAEELELEGEWGEATIAQKSEPERAAMAPAAAQPRPQAQPKTQPKKQKPSPLEQERAKAQSATRTASDKQVLQYNRQADLSGKGLGDLSQRPVWQQALLWLFAVSVLGALAYGSYVLTQEVKQGRSQPADMEP